MSVGVLPHFNETATGGVLTEIGELKATVQRLQRTQAGLHQEVERLLSERDSLAKLNSDLEREKAELHVECDRLMSMLTGQLDPIEDLPLKHTSGRWHRNVPPATKYNTIWAGRNTHVARVVTDGGLTPEEVEANCALIAAAPKLLSALHTLEKSVRGVAESAVQRAAEKARVAIAQALVLENTTEN